MKHAENGGVVNNVANKEQGHDKRNGNKEVCHITQVELLQIRFKTIASRNTRIDVL